MLNFDLNAPSPKPRFSFQYSPRNLWNVIALFQRTRILAKSSKPAMGSLIACMSFPVYCKRISREESWIVRSNIASISFAWTPLRPKDNLSIWSVLRKYLVPRNLPLFRQQSLCQYWNFGSLLGLCLPTWNIIIPMYEKGVISLTGNIAKPRKLGPYAPFFHTLSFLYVKESILNNGQSLPPDISFTRTISQRHVCIRKVICKEIYQFRPSRLFLY